MARMMNVAIKCDRFVHYLLLNITDSYYCTSKNDSNLLYFIKESLDNVIATYKRENYASLTSRKKTEKNVYHVTMEIESLKCFSIFQHNYIFNQPTFIYYVFSVPFS